MNNNNWPILPYKKWKDTLDTIHMWMEIVGKIKLQLCPFLNQWWEVTFFVTPTGMTTGKIPYKDYIFEVNFNFLTHTMTIQTSKGETKSFFLKPQMVSTFYKEFINMLKELNIFVAIWPVPVEVVNPIPFAQDTTHASYNKEYVERWWSILVQVQKVFDEFRASFSGKSSPIHFFWGSFDLNGTRFSGKKTASPKMKGVMGKIMKYSENEENFAFGFWPGDERFPHAAFYSYMYPKPIGIETITFDYGSSFNEQLKECILPYEVVRKTMHPEKSIANFLESTYKESAKLAGWNIASLTTTEPVIS